MATATQTYSPVSSLSSHSSASSSSGRLSLPRLKTPQNSGLQPYNNSNELSAISCSSAVSQIIGQYLYTPLTATPEVYRVEDAPEKQLFWEEKKETVEDMIYALDRVLGMAPGSNAGGRKGEVKEVRGEWEKKEDEVKPVAVKPVVKVEKPVERVEKQLHWEEKESVEDMINALNRVIERGGMGTPTSDGYTPLTATAENFRLDIGAEPEEIKRLFMKSEAPMEEGKKGEEPHGLSRMLSNASMDVPVAFEDLLYEHAKDKGMGMMPKRQSGVRRGSKAPVSSRLSELRGIQTGPRKAGTSALYDSPIDWAPIQRMPARNTSEPLSALSPQSCITDAFTEETRWSSIRGGQGQDDRSGYSSYAADNEEDDWETSRSCTETSIDDEEDDEILSPCETATNWDGVTIIDDDETCNSIAEDLNLDNDDEYYCDTPTTIIIAPPPPTSAPPPPPPAAIAQEDSGKEVLMSPVISCRINTIANLDFPMYIPSPQARRAATSPLPTPSLCPAPVPSPQPRNPSHAATDPLTISRQAMRQEWTETPPMKLDLASIPPPTRSTTPNSRPGTSAGARKESPLPWLTSRSASPARSIEEKVKEKVKEESVKRTRSPRGWKLW